MLAPPPLADEGRPSRLGGAFRRGSTSIGFLYRTDGLGKPADLLGRESRFRRGISVPLRQERSDLPQEPCAQRQALRGDEREADAGDVAQGASLAPAQKAHAAHQALRHDRHGRAERHGRARRAHILGAARGRRAPLQARDRRGAGRAARAAGRRRGRADPARRHRAGGRRGAEVRRCWPAKAPERLFGHGAREEGPAAGRSRVEAPCGPARAIVARVTSARVGSPRNRAGPAGFTSSGTAPTAGQTERWSGHDGGTLAQARRPPRPRARGPLPGGPRLGLRRVVRQDDEQSERHGRAGPPEQRRREWWLERWRGPRRLRGRGRPGPSPIPDAPRCRARARAGPTPGRARSRPSGTDRFRSGPSSLSER